MRFAKHLFRTAFIYGLIALVPLYFQETQFGKDYPPALTHVEFYYGFIGVALAWQFAFLIISRDPSRYRLLILPGILEKLTFGIPALILSTQQRLPLPLLAGAIIDLCFATLFTIAYLRLPAAAAD